MLFSRETLRAFAQSKGIVNIDDDALRILSQDVEYRIKEICQEASKFMVSSHRTKLSVTDVNHAMISRNIEPLFGYDSKETLVFRGLPCSIFYVPDEEIDLEEYLEKPLPRIPLKPYIQSHWLAIEGVQPPIQQNPTFVEKPVVKLDTLASYQEQMELKQHHKHLLTKELSMYFSKILQAIDSNPDVAIECLLNETGIQQLVPYFIYHFKLEIRNNTANTELISTLLKMYFSLLNNKYIFIDPYLHEIIPTLMACLISKDMEYEARHLSAEIVKHIYYTFGPKYRNLPQRIINFLKNVWLDDGKDEEEQYGALLCLSMLPGIVITTHVIPNIAKYKSNSSKVNEMLSQIVKNNEKERQVDIQDDLN